MRWWTRLWPIVQAVLEAFRRWWTAKGIAAGKAQEETETHLRNLRDERALRDTRERLLRAMLISNRRKLQKIDQEIQEWHEQHPPQS